MDQTDGPGAFRAPEWPEKLLQILQEVDVGVLASDVAPFLERKQEVALLTPENFSRILRSDC
ncbi:MAG: hypothetical protein HYU36_23795 [Planctomycetes bacterium]|nr:hypothetical protein [Planctomycetota bacterium]